MALYFQVPQQHIGDVLGEGMTEMGHIVGRDAAHVQGDGIIAYRQRLNLLALAVIQVHSLVGC